MEEDRLGLTPEEREQLALGSEFEKGMDLKTSMLAFAGLLLICIMIAAASLIVQSRGRSDLPGKDFPPSHTREESHAGIEDDRHEGALEPEKARAPSAESGGENSPTIRIPSE